MSCFVLFFCFTLFWCRTLLVDFTATRVKNVVPIDEAQLVWPSSPNDSIFAAKGTGSPSLLCHGLE